MTAITKIKLVVVGLSVTAIVLRLHLSILDWLWVNLSKLCIVKVFFEQLFLDP